MKVCYFFWNEEANYGDKSSYPMLLVLSRLEPLGCGRLFFIGRSAVCFGCLCVREDESLLLFLITERKTNPVLKISCLTSLALHQ